MPPWRDGRARRFPGGTVTEYEARERVAGILAHWDEHGYGMCAVRERSTGRLVGLCGLGRIEDEIQVAYKFWPAFWGKGYTDGGSAG